MESLRDVKRVMEREIEKGSCPLQFEYLEFGEKPFQFIESEEKLNEVLSYLLRLGEYRGYTEHLVGNNVYMDLDIAQVLLHGAVQHVKNSGRKAQNECQCY